MFCSTIIPTVNRPTLNRAVNSVINQDFPAENYEVIVVNDSGTPLSPAVWQDTGRVKIVETQKQERSVARNIGASIANGRYLHFLDDDDWLLPGALQALHEVTRSNPKEWIYGGTQLVDRNGKDIIQLEHELQGNCFTQIMAGEWIPLQSSIILSDLFFNLEGFSASLSESEDVDLCRRVALHGDFAYTGALVACVGIGEESSTTVRARSEIAGRKAREKILNQSGVFNRMRDSADTNSLTGRMVRIYLTSVLWNLKHRKVFSAINRMVYALLSFLYSGKSIFRSGYWQAIGTPYTSDTFLRGFQEAGLPVTSR